VNISRSVWDPKSGIHFDGTWGRSAVEEIRGP